MNNKLLKTAVGWGIFLWVVGYILGFVFYELVPPSEVGWYIMPIGVLVTLWALFKKVRGASNGDYLGIAVVWTVIAIVLDWLFIVKALHPADGYYKPDVYVYYALTFIIPVAFGLFGSPGRGDAQSRAKILALMTGGKQVANDDVQRTLGVSDATATRYLDALEKSGDIVQVGTTGRGVVYRKK